MDGVDVGCKTDAAVIGLALMALILPVGDDGTTHQHDDFAVSGSVLGDGVHGAD